MKNLSALLLIVLLGNLSLSAQSMIEGSITNAQGESVVATVVTIQHKIETELNKTITIDESGYFIIENLADGTYSLAVENVVYQTILIDNLEFPRDTDKVLGLTLENLNELTPTDVFTKRNTPKNNVAISSVY